jgi:hypothetical protein
MTVREEILKQKLDLVGVQEVRWDGGGSEQAGEYTFFYGKRDHSYQLSICFLYIRESYQPLKGTMVMM